ncbi:IS481 family transposase [Pseudonocardia sp. HH130629-09]|uniref:IS481 family transposase n=1 Tax=Pseudonocardia sp. HH130629-09 TaxID=1641402 RepID=UPI0006CB5F6C|nr:IS481 family transposase [Pseudonocardia sp. HH130629-09]ALE82472.1 transposase [Pseudonocardia sp. HH130629-09]
MHANARLTLHGRRLLVARVRDHGRPQSHVARELGVSRQCVSRWVTRYDREGDPGLRDRSSRPHHSPTRHSADTEQAVLAARREQRCGPAAIAATTGVAARSVSRILARHGVARLAACDPITGAPIRATRASAHRYEHAAPGELVHVDVKKLGRIPDGGGWRIHGRGPRPGATRRIGFDYVHAMVDDHSRFAYAEVLPDEKGATCAGFVQRAAAAFAAAGIGRIERVITDNARNYRGCRVFAEAVTGLGARQKFIRPHCPWINGKVERFNRTLAIEWAYRRPYATNDDRTLALSAWLEYYNQRRPHTACAGRSPISRLSPT